MALLQPQHQQALNPAVAVVALKQALAALAVLVKPTQFQVARLQEQVKIVVELITLLVAVVVLLTTAQAVRQE